MEDKVSVEHILSIPYAEIPEKTLGRMIEAFVLREGTDYGEQEFSLDQKVSHVLSQLERGEVGVIFDSKEETFDIRKVEKRKNNF
jgi:uncharacterized protein YheU (UPF0270 family)